MASASSSQCPTEAVSRAERHYAADLGRIASQRELRHLADEGLVSLVAVEHAADQIAEYLAACERDRYAVPIDVDEDVGA